MEITIDGKAFVLPVYKGWLTAGELLKLAGLDTSKYCITRIVGKKILLQSQAPTNLMEVRDGFTFTSKCIWPCVGD